MNQRPLLIRLEYAQIGARDVSALSDWYCNILGLQEIDRHEGVAYLTCGGDGSVGLSLAPGNGGMQNVAASINSVEELDEFVERSERRGGSWQRQSDPYPGVSHLARISLPQRYDFDVVIRQNRRGYLNGTDWSPGAVHAPTSFNHIGISTTDIVGLTEFLGEHLGLLTSDQVLKPDGSLGSSFMRISSNHHDVSIFSLGRDALHHVAFLVADVGELVVHADRLARLGYRPDTGIGRHGPGNNIFLYARDCEENRVELSTQLAIVTDPGAPIRVWPADSSRFNLWAQKADRAPSFLNEHMT